MKSLQIGRYPETTILDLPVPVPGDGQIVMRVEAVATCPQWDLHLRHNEPMFIGHQFSYPYTPGQPGHEATGYVAAVGPHVEGMRVGDRISAWRDAGHNLHGCYAQFVLLPAESVIHVPIRLPFTATASVELAMCVGATFLMLKEMKVLQGKRVAINGLGPAGLVAAQMAKAEGAAEVVGFDLAADRCRYALEHCGLTAACTPEEAAAELYPVRPHRPSLDTGVDCVGAKRSVEWLMDRTLDTVALFGVQREDYAFSPCHYHPPLRLCGYPGHSRAAAEYAVALMESGDLDLGILVTHQMRLAQYNTGIDLLEQQKAIKVCFTPWAAAPPQVARK